MRSGLVPKHWILQHVQYFWVGHWIQHKDCTLAPAFKGRLWGSSCVYPLKWVSLTSSNLTKQPQEAPKSALSNSSGWVSFTVASTIKITHQHKTSHCLLLHILSRTLLNRFITNTYIYENNHESKFRCHTRSHYSIDACLSYIKAWKGVVVAFPRQQPRQYKESYLEQRIVSGSRRPFRPRIR
jgi:hypothetical protein